MPSLLIDPEIVPDGRAYTALGDDSVLNKAQITALATVAGQAAKRLIVVDSKASGTNAPNGTASTWNTRELNLVDVNDIVGASLATNQVTLPVGTYRIWAVAPVHTNSGGVYTKLRFRNITDGTTEKLGTQARVDGDAATNVRMTDEVFCVGEFTVSGSSKVFELQQWLSNTDTNTLGIAATTGENEIYAILMIEEK